MPVIQPGVAFAMLVGPGEAEMAIDTVEGILEFYPTAAIWMRDDRTSDGTWEKLSQWAEGRAVHLSRNPIRQGYFGIAKSLSDLLLLIIAAGKVPEIVIKIDTDAILIRPGLVEVFQQKFAEKGPGACGSYDVAPDGSKRRGDGHARTFLLDMLPFGLGHGRTFRWKRVFYLPYLIQARQNGYILGEHILGAILAIHGSTLMALERNGFLASIPEKHNCCMRPEDVLISMAVKSVGHQLISVNDYPEKVVAWLRAFRPLGITQEEAWDRKLLAVHPIKKQDAEMRRFFREKRSAAR